jgi:hypothetical protein
MMPRYFFEIRDGDRLTVDDLGTEAAGIESARDLATVALTELAKDVLPGSSRRKLAIDVRDGTEVVLRTTLVFKAERLR